MVVGEATDGLSGRAGANQHVGALNHDPRYQIDLKRNFDDKCMSIFSTIRVLKLGHGTEIFHFFQKLYEFKTPKKWKNLCEYVNLGTYGTAAPLAPW